MEFQKHAYLILAHEHFIGLSYLLKALDHPSNDIYIHIDRKVSDFPREELIHSCSSSNVFFVKQHAIYWGDSSILKAEYALFKEAFPQKYHYYHLISGTHFPLISQDELHSIFENENRLYINCHTENEDDPFHFKIQYYYPFHHHYRNIASQSGINKIVLKMITKSSQALLSLQKKLSINRLQENFTYIKGNQWVSIPHDFVEFLLTQEKKSYQMYRNTYCSDEIFLPSIAYNSIYKERIYDYSNTYVDWIRGRPYTFCDQDYEELITSPFMFARKISYESSPVLVQNLMMHLSKK